VKDCLWLIGSGVDTTTESWNITYERSVVLVVQSVNSVVKWILRNVI